MQRCILSFASKEEEEEEEEEENEQNVEIMFSYIV